MREFGPKMKIEDAVTDFDLSRTPAAVLCRLDASLGRFVVVQDLRDAIEEVTGSRTTELAVVTAIRRIRKALHGRGVVETRKGIGYRLTWL